MKFTSTRRAFSLVEVLVALVVLSVGIYSVAGLISSSQHAAVGGDYRIRASALAQLKLAELSASPDLGQVAAARAGTPVSVPEEGWRPFEQNTKFEWRAVLERGETPADRVDVRVEVRSAGKGGSAQPSVAATAFIFAPAPQKEKQP